MASEYDFVCKVLLLGDAGVGKSSLLVRFTEGTFSEAYAGTVGVDFKTRIVKQGDKVVKLQIWDTAGQERFRTITRSYYRGAHGVIIVYDVTDRASFDSVERWIQEIDELANDGVQKVLVGNKCDVTTGRAVEPHEAKALAARLGLRWLEASAKSVEGVEEAFEAAVAGAPERHAFVPAQSYGPPLRPREPPLRPREVAQRPQCCQHLGPQGAAGRLHAGSSADRGLVAASSAGLQGLPEWPSERADKVLLQPDAFPPGLVAVLAAAVRTGTPLVLRAGHGLLPAEALDALLPESLGRRFGERRLPIARLREDGYSAPPFRSSAMQLREFLDRSIHRPAEEAERRQCYLQQLPVEQHLPELAASGLPLRGPAALRAALGEEELLVTCTLFCGAAGVRTSLHFDRGDYATRDMLGEARTSIDNLFLQLSGYKRFRLFRPCDHELLYPRGATDPGAPHVSQVEDVEAVDAERFPLFQQAAANSLEVLLGPGEGLLVPRWWWHQTAALTDGHAVNWWFELPGPPEGGASEQ